MLIPKKSSMIALFVMLFLAASAAFAQQGRATIFGVDQRLMNSAIAGWKIEKCEDVN